MDRAIKHSEEFLERAAIIEFCGNVSREEAERLAAVQIRNQIAKANRKTK